MKLNDLIALVRAPAALSVPGDAVAGAVAADCLDRRTAGIATASACLYWAGMAANDWADRDVDAVERPGRPIPSGRVRPGEALAVAGALTAAGLAIAGKAGGRRTALTAALLATAVWTYDIRLKNTAAGPAGMALCRGLDVLMGASPARIPRAVLPAAVVAAHTYTLTELSRREVGGADRTLPAITLAATAGVAAAAAGAPVVGRRAARAVTAALAGWYAAAFGLAQGRALASPDAGRIRAAVGAGISRCPRCKGLSRLAMAGRSPASRSRPPYPWVAH